jgi:hypothetical protein
MRHHARLLFSKVQVNALRIFVILEIQDLKIRTSRTETDCPFLILIAGKLTTNGTHAGMQFPQLRRYIFKKNRLDMILLFVLQFEVHAPILVFDLQIHENTTQALIQDASYGWRGWDALQGKKMIFSIPCVAWERERHAAISGTA